MMKVNAFCTAAFGAAIKSCDKLVFCGEFSKGRAGDERVLRFDAEIAEYNGSVFLPSLTDEQALERFCDYIVAATAQAFVRAAYDLTETGIIEARYKLSPIMLLHRLGVLEKCTIVGGVCLDNDDLDLMAQESVPLVLLPTADAGYGYGYAPVCAALKRGIRVGVGTFDAKYNQNADINTEMSFLKLAANAEMRTENALSAADIKKILAFE